MKKTNKAVKDMVNPVVFQKVDKATDLFLKACDAQAGMMKTADALTAWDKNRGKDRWEFQLKIGGMNQITIGENSPFADLVGETIKQFLQLLDAIYFTERHSAIKEFNQILEEKKDGTYSSK